RNRSHASFFQQDSLNFFGAFSGFFDIHPGIESASWRLASETGDFVKASDEQVAALLVFGGHRIDGIGRVTQSFDRGDLGKLRYARKGVEHEQVHGVDDTTWRYAVSEAPTGHRKALRKTVDDDGALGHARERPRREISTAEEDARVDFVAEEP